MPLKAHIASLKGPIVVTGASGFIGANLFHLLSKERADVFAIVQRNKEWRLATIDNSKIIAVDLNDLSATKNLVESLNPQTVFDLVSFGAYSFEEDAELIYQTNFLAMVNFVQLLAKQNIAAYIHAGSSSEYGANSAAPEEIERCEPNSHYAVSKVAATTHLEYMAKTHAFPAINLRLYSVYGPLEDSSRLIPNLVRHALVGNLPPFVSPLTSRDFVYVEDVSKILYILISQELTGVVNIGHGEEVQVGTITRKVSKLIGREELLRLEIGKNEKSYIVSDPKKLISLIGNYKWTPLETALKKTIEARKQ